MIPLFATFKTWYYEYHRGRVFLAYLESFYAEANSCKNFVSKFTNKYKHLIHINSYQQIFGYTLSEFEFPNNWTFLKILQKKMLSNSKLLFDIATTNKFLNIAHLFFNKKIQ